MCKFLFFMCTLTFSAFADEFLARGEKADLLIDLEANLGSNIITGRMQRLTQIAGPMYKSLPKRRGELISPTVTRYALQRILVEQHGWTMQHAETSNESATVVETLGALLNGILPQHVFDMLATSLLPDGLSLDELAIVAALMEHFVYEDQKSMFRSVLQAFNLPTRGSLPMSDLLSALKIQLSIFFQYNEIDELTEFRSFDEALEEAFERFPGWPDAELFIEDQVFTLAYHLQKDSKNPFEAYLPTVETGVRAVELISDRVSSQFGAHNCNKMKDDLLEYEYAQSGRVRLADFYRKTFTSKFFFVETLAYLEAAGTVDLTDQEMGPKVLVPNYVQMPGNCLAYNHLYSVCCQSECEALMNNLEHRFAAPYVLPNEILPLISSLSTSTVQAPRNLSDGLAMRLHNVAASQGGHVILHSRLFSQWMHQAFPRECPYPHLSGKTTPMDNSRWEDVTGIKSRVDHEGPETRPQLLRAEIAKLEASYSRHPSQPEEAAEHLLDWAAEDEHFIEPTESMMTVLRRLVTPVLLMLVVAVGGALLTSYKSGRGKEAKGATANTATVFV